MGMQGISRCNMGLGKRLRTYFRKHIMDRRKFLSGVGTVGTIGAVATGMAVRESSVAKTRAGGLAQAAGAGSQTGQTPVAAQANKAMAAQGMTLGYLPGSAGMFATPVVERLMRVSAAGLHWTRWDASLTTQANQSAIHSLFKVSSLVNLSVGLVRRSDDAAASALKGLDITAHFALDDAPYFASFSAWCYEGSGLSAFPLSSRFIARTPDRVALAVNYALQPSAVANGISNAGNLYLPIGANAATAGLATGLYVLATPSAYTGVQPDFSNYAFSGDVRAPIVDPSGRAVDFDYVTLAIRPVAI
jgi:hypothetical protein